MSARTDDAASHLRLRRRRERRGCLSKKRFAQRKQAVRSRHRLIRFEGFSECLRVYDCEFCGGYHLGNSKFREVTVAKAQKGASIRPIEDYLVVAEDSGGPERTEGGLIIPDAAKEQPTEGTVVAVGPGRLLDNGMRGEMPFVPGERIIYKKYGGSRVKVDGQHYLILRVAEVLCVVE